MRRKSYKENLFIAGAVFFVSCAAQMGLVEGQALKDLFDEGAKAFYDGDYDKAVKSYERIIEMDPNFAPAYNALGLALKVQGASNNDVVFYFNKAVELDPNFLPSYDNLGKLYYSAGDVDRAEEYFGKALKIDPDNESVVLSMGWIYLLGRNDPDKAIKYFHKMAEKTNSAMGYFGEGICLMSKDKRMEVIDIVTKLRSINQEGLAIDLETMLRENRKLTRSPEFPTPQTIKTEPNEQQPRPTPAPAPKDSPATPPRPAALSEYDEQGELQVRLLDKLPTD